MMRESKYNKPTVVLYVFCRNYVVGVAIMVHCSLHRPRHGGMNVTCQCCLPILGMERRFSNFLELTAKFKSILRVAGAGSISCFQFSKVKLS